MTEPKDYIDIRGVKAQIGDKIAVGFRVGNSGGIDVGTVVGFTSMKKRGYGDPNIRQNQIEIRWDVEPGKTWEKKNSKIDADNGRFLIIESLPEVAPDTES